MTESEQFCSQKWRRCKGLVSMDLKCGRGMDAMNGIKWCAIRKLRFYSSCFVLGLRLLDYKYMLKAKLLVKMLKLNMYPTRIILLAEFCAYVCIYMCIHIYLPRGLLLYQKGLLYS
jgi:hypothetical protein